MAHRPAKVYTGSGWDDIGDSRLLTHNHDGSTGGVQLPQSSITNLTTDLAAKAATVKQATAPTGNAQTIWYDSSTTPPTAKFWDGSAWQVFSSARSAVYGSSTGSPSISSDSSYTYYKFTGSGSITFSAAGLVDLLVVGSGGGGDAGQGKSGGGGAGGVRFGTFSVAASAYTVTVGAGGAAGGNGNASSFGSVLMAGGGGKATAYGELAAIAVDGFGGGGSPGGFTFAQIAVTGGGAGGTVYGTNTYDGIPLSYSGASVTYGVGGYTGTSGAANTGNGGYGVNPGGSGIVIVRIAK